MHIYHMCTDFYEAQATLFRRRKQVTMFREVTQTTAGRVQGRGEQEHTVGQRLGVSVVQIDLQGKHLVDVAFTS